jgi:phosphatidyl-myo-inositol dimannoside synthase
VVAKCAGEADMIHLVDRSVDVSLVPNGVDRAAFQPAIIPDAGPLRLLCVARLIERKGQQHLIEAVRRLIAKGIDITLDLVGTGDAHSALQAQAAAAGIADRVHFIGYVPREAIAAYYAAAHVFVLPSYNEGMSVATLEALAAGLPVVVTRTGGTAELVAEGVNGLTFDWADVGALAEHLTQLALDRQLARSMGAASRARAGCFSWESAAERYLNMFETIAAGASSGLPKSEVML